MYSRAQVCYRPLDSEAQNSGSIAWRVLEAAVSADRAGKSGLVFRQPKQSSLFPLTLVLPWLARNFCSTYVVSHRPPVVRRARCKFPWDTCFRGNCTGTLISVISKNVMQLHVAVGIEEAGDYHRALI